MNSQRWRKAAGALVLAAAVVTIALLSGPYWENRAYSEALGQLVIRPDTSSWTMDRWQAEAARTGAQLGIPVRPSEVTVSRTPSGTRLEARYQKNMDLLFYSVRLHMRARSGS